MDRVQILLNRLYQEAECLDEGRYRDWLGFLTEDILYRVPVRITKERDPRGGTSGVTEGMYHMDEDLTSLEMRVARLETGFAWAEDPPSRIRRFVTNVRIGDPRPTDRGEEVEVRSNLLIFRSRWDKPDYTLMAAERQDVWRYSGDTWRLARRLVILDSTTLPVHNLAFFF
ncbi:MULTISPECIES: aromatic-ring-hydroxylating dioxygenase subunit beta [Thermus]|uniref:Aromatic-ring-hydroxylating dioxygenase subunit beta n=1 Tax=Thermus scotoductus TaxID=37636 RepID=A0A430R6L5_THESC|nr:MULTISPECIES: 3-phenylpropionate/cinnamic acid dioxygenase subunit beta [Thermus]RTG95933.1 aromatic-ring-hydroxylating dioxygenase subunit beta [Thermus scotoductus]RTH03072.1 aromatic-ring-hydroxylating dioxygenase subunit beta [Thermus scotoductus]RTH17086.1 aromatic-ring-hydroxylating dioxygenase subunit beta [Thermus scotoductus]RTH97629.1 aromatic-ring-hydroxylating dioxygenase subunit beta [Thermus scotoductus]RTI18574.1 aromatic-ring-hydroxylating dioxygenase subunit beta [Thermus s